MDEKVMARVREHYDEALGYFPKDRIVGIFLQGSQNYGLETPQSDVDTKLIITPTFKDVAFNKSAVSTTHVRANNEHTDFKDIRLYMQTFRKQNLNFLEILFTPYAIINPLYEKEWMKLVEHREEIAHYNRYYAVKAMKGIALQKFHAMEHRYPSKIEIIDKIGYDPKQLHHLLRIDEYLERYINGESFEACLKPKDPEFLKEVKLGCFSLDEARLRAKAAMDHIDENSAFITKDSKWNITDTGVEKLLNEVQYNIMKTAITKELD